MTRINVNFSAPCGVDVDLLDQPQPSCGRKERAQSEIDIIAEKLISNSFPNYCMVVVKITKSWLDVAKEFDSISKANRFTDPDLSQWASNWQTRIDKIIQANAFSILLKENMNSEINYLEPLKKQLNETIEFIKSDLDHPLYQSEKYRNIISFMNHEWSALTQFYRHNEISIETSGPIIALRKSSIAPYELPLDSTTPAILFLSGGVSIIRLLKSFEHQVDVMQWLTSLSRKIASGLRLNSEGN